MIKFTLLTLIMTLTGLLLNCSPQQPRFPDGLKAPVAQKHPVELTSHGHTRIDPYYWLKERENEEVIRHLNEENEYLTAMMAHTGAFRKELFREIRGRIKEDDRSVPYYLDGYYYYTRYGEGREYPVYARKNGSLDAEEQVMVDANVLAEGQSFFAMTGVNVSTNGKLAAFGVDTVGRRIYTIRFLDLETGEMLADEIPGVTGNMAWAADNQTIFYTRQDAQTLRSNQVFRHRLGDDTAGNKLVYQEDDDTFRTYVMRTKSRGYISIVSSSTVSTEYRVIPAGEPTADARVIQPRQRDLLYYADHFGDYFYIRTNDQAENFRLMRAPVNRPDIGNWEEVIAHREDVLLEGIDIFRDFLVLSERKEGLMQIRTRNWESGEEHYLDFDEPAYYAYTTTNPSFETGTLRYAYTSLTTPASTYDYDMAGRTSILLKESEVLGGFNREHYVTERHMATAKDGTAIPVSLVYRKGLKRDGSNPLLQYAYGSYGYSMDPSFSSTRLSLLDRGFVYAIAHIRGGQEMGRHWYDQGKLKHKMNTFTDFIDVSEYLIGEDFTSTENLYAMGGSAGGLLMGAIVNMRPDLYKGVIAAVPFVDVVTTMLDDSIPLTTSEYDEWGNPNDPEYYDVMMAYSPYDNVKPQDYPNMLVTSGLHDSQVQYWEPTKWVSKLRDLKTDDNVLLLHTNMDAGHGGASGRFQRLREVALQYAFLLELSGRGRDARK